MKLFRFVTQTVAFALLVWSAPQVARSETIPVRSGEHGNFTRIVLDLASSREWTLERENNNARLALKGAKVDFDLSDAFRRIGVGRIRDLQVSNKVNTLSIVLNCDCSLEAFQLGSRMLVIDVKGESTSLITPSKRRSIGLRGTPASFSSEAVSKKALEHAFPFDAASSALRPLLEYSPLADTSSDPTPRAFDVPALQEDELASGDDGKQNGGLERVVEAEQILAEQLRRAVSLGLVTLRTASPANQKSVTQAKQEPTHKEDARPKPENEPNTPGLNLRAETSADRDFLDALGSLARTKNGGRCLSDAQLNITSWAGEQSFSRQIGAYRASLMGEFDRPNKDVARKLAQFYIHYGFGAEALHVLEALEGADGDFILLKNMGEIMEYGHARSPGIFANQFDCDTAAVFWAILAYDTLPDMVEFNAKAMLRTISELPPHLRNLLGPLASNRLRSMQYDQLAGQVLRLVERGNQIPDAHYEMALADQQLTEGDVVSASSSLSNVIASNSDLSPIALIKRIDSRVTADLPIEFENAVLAGAYAQEYRKQPMGVYLKRAHILALSETGAYDEAFTELSLFVADAPQEMISQIRSHALLTLAENGSDQSFLKHSLGTVERDLSSLNIASANAVASRLIALGFSARADHYLQSGTDESADQERRLLRARSALAQKKPRRAEVDLLGLSGSEANLLLAQAHSMRGEHQTAQDLFSTLEETGPMIEEAWLAGDWNILGNSEDKLLVEVAELMKPPETETPSEGGETGVLGQNQALLEKSTAARETMERLLARYQVENMLPSSE